MSDDNKTEKKGFFSRIFSGLTGSTNSEVEEESSIELPTLSAIKAMKKADIVSSAKENGLDLDISNTKAQLLESWEGHFLKADSPSAVDDAAEIMAESAVSSSQSKDETPAEEATPEEEAPVEEETPAEEEATPEEEEAPVEEEATPEEEAPVISDVEKSPASIVSDFEKSQLKQDIPPFRPGDTVLVSVKVKDGERTRLQAFEGVVMSVRNSGLNSSFIVRKISSGIGVERTFQLHSPLIDSITVKRKGDVRKAKLFYLRERSGKSARIKERLD